MDDCRRSLLVFDREIRMEILDGPVVIEHGVHKAHTVISHLR